MTLPLRISRDRIVLYGAALFAVALWQLSIKTLRDPNLADWGFFWAGGAAAGTPALLDPQLHLAFERAHGLQGGIWPYLPAFAWLYVPASHLSLTASYAIDAVAMIALAAIAGVLLADAFAMPRWFGAVMALAWPPVNVAALGGQNTPLALLLVAIAIRASRRGCALGVGLAIALLMYKPSIAAPFVILLLVRREWRALAVVAVCAACWYLLSVAAAAGDWAWPALYARATTEYYAADFLSNAANAMSLPGLLLRFGVSSTIAIGAGIALLVVCLPRLARAGLAEALAVTSTLAVAVSPHAWHYEPVILLPAIFYAMTVVSQPAITWLVAAAYVIAEISILNVPLLPWNVLIVVVLSWTALVVLCHPERSDSLSS